MINSIPPPKFSGVELRHNMADRFDTTLELPKGWGAHLKDEYTLTVAPEGIVSSDYLPAGVMHLKHDRENRFTPWYQFPIIDKLLFLPEPSLIDKLPFIDQLRRLRDDKVITRRVQLSLSEQTALQNFCRNRGPKELHLLLNELEEAANQVGQVNLITQLKLSAAKQMFEPKQVSGSSLEDKNPRKSLLSFLHRANSPDAQLKEFASSPDFFTALIDKLEGRKTLTKATKETRETRESALSNTYKEWVPLSEADDFNRLRLTIEVDPDNTRGDQRYKAPVEEAEHSSIWSPPPAPSPA